MPFVHMRKRWVMGMNFKYSIPEQFYKITPCFLKESVCLY